jgi:hypothetical protein
MTKDFQIQFQICLQIFNKWSSAVAYSRELASLLLATRFHFLLWAFREIAFKVDYLNNEFETMFETSRDYLSKEKVT